MPPVPCRPELFCLSIDKSWKVKYHSLAMLLSLNGFMMDANLLSDANVCCINWLKSTVVHNKLKHGKDTHTRMRTHIPHLVSLLTSFDLPFTIWYFSVKIAACTLLPAPVGPSNITCGVTGAAERNLACRNVRTGLKIVVVTLPAWIFKTTLWKHISNWLVSIYRGCYTLIAGQQVLMVPEENMLIMVDGNYTLLMIVVQLAMQVSINSTILLLQSISNF